MTFGERLMREHPELWGRALTEVGCPRDYGYEDAAALESICSLEGHHDCGQCWYREIPTAEDIINAPITSINEFTAVPPDDIRKLAFGKIQDSGERQEFETGAVRDIQKGKGRCDLMPLEVVAHFCGPEERSPVYYIAKFKATGDTEELYLALGAFCQAAYESHESTMFLEVAIHFEEGAEKYGENNWQKGLPVKCYINSAVRHYLKWLRGDKDEPHDRAFVWNLMCCIWEVDYSPRAKEEVQGARTWQVGNFKFTDRPDRVSFVYEPKDETANAESEPDVWVRLGDCPVGLFVFGDALHAKTSSASPGGIRVIKLNTGDAEWYHPDILVRPLEIDVKELFAGEPDE